MNGKVVSMYRWRTVVHTAGTRPHRITHAFSRFRNRSSAPEWIAMCGRTFDRTTFAASRQSGDSKCFACVTAVSPYAGP